MPQVLITPIQLVRTRGPCQELLTAAGFEIVYPPPGIALVDPNRLIEHLAGVDAMLASSERLDHHVLSSSRLRAIARVGVGYDAVDVTAATELGIVVTITPGANQVSVAEHTLALLLGVTRGFPARDRDIRLGKWRRQPLAGLANKTIGLVGLGRIGMALVPRLQALEMTVVAHDPGIDPRQAEAVGVRLCTLAELLATADVVSLHLPCTQETKNLINADTLAQMKHGAILINTARGGLVDEAALCEALASGHVAAAGLDTFQVEPLPATSPLLAFDNVLVSPHMAGIDVESSTAMSSMAAQSIIDLHQGRCPSQCVVNRELFPGWRW